MKEGDDLSSSVMGKKEAISKIILPRHKSMIISYKNNLISLKKKYNETTLIPETKLIPLNT